MQRINVFLLAAVVSLLIVAAGLLHALSQHPPYAQQVDAEQVANSALKSEKNAKREAQNPTQTNEEHGRKYPEQREDEGSEFWPSFLGVRLKITDSLLAAFTFGLLIFTGLLWNSTEKLWVETRDTGKRQEADTRILQRAYISVNIGGISPYRTVDSSEGKHTVNGIVEIINVGHLPASQISCCVKISRSDSDVFDDLTIDESDYFGNYVLPPGGVMKQGSEPIDLAAGGWVYAWGQVRYLDGFGNARFTNFCHRYPRIMLRKLKSGRYGIPKKYGRYHLTGNHTDEG